MKLDFNRDGSVRDKISVGMRAIPGWSLLWLEALRDDFRGESDVDLLADLARGRAPHVARLGST